MALLSMRADKFWKRTEKKISIQGSDVAGFDKSKFECFNCHKMGHFARECRAPRSQEKGRRESYRQGSKAEEKSSKALMSIDRKGGETPTEFALMANVENKVFDNSLCSKDCMKNTDSLNNKINELKSELSESNTYRPSPSVVSTSAEDQNKDTFTSEDAASPNLPKPFVKFVKSKDSQPESSETLEQTFNRLQAIVSYLEFMDVELEQDDLNQKFLTSLALEWLMYTIVWRNRGDLDTMSLDDVYNHLKVYEPEVQKKSESNSQNMAFISSANTSSGKGEVHTASVPTASTQVYTASADVVAASISHDTCRAPRSQDKGRRESYKQSSKEEEPTPKALMAIDEIGWDWSYMANEEENHALVADAEAPTEYALMAKSSSSFESEKDLLWTGLPEFMDDTVTDYSRPSPTVVSTSAEDQNKDTSTSEDAASPNPPKLFVKFVKSKDSQLESKSKEQETPKKSQAPSYETRPFLKSSAVKNPYRAPWVPTVNR
nr:ribonuclease H-like domain-containing protein [Tanacetum cinerariifolium]